MSSMRARQGDDLTEVREARERRTGSGRCAVAADVGSIGGSREMRGGTQVGADGRMERKAHDVRNSISVLLFLGVEKRGKMFNSQKKGENVAHVSAGFSVSSLFCWVLLPRT